MGSPELRWILIRRLACCALATVLATSSAVAQEAVPIEVQDVDLRTNESLGTVVVRSERPVEWSTEAGNRTLVLFLPRTVPGPKALDRASRTGLVSLVEVGFAVPDGVPTTRITIHSRQAFTHEVEGSGAGLTIRLRASGEAGAAGAGSSEASAAAEGSAAGSASLEDALRENEQLKRRMAELHADRLELRESLEAARRELADQARAAEEGQAGAQAAAENRRLLAQIRTRDEQLAEARKTAAEAETRAEELSSRVAAAERQVEIAAKSNESERRAAAEAEARAEELSSRLAAAEQQAEIAAKSNESEQLAAALSERSAALAQSREAAAELQARIDQLVDELASARSAAAASDVETRLAESSRRELELEQKLRESRSDSSSLRAWLSRAPEILQVREFVVTPGDSCLPLRPEPAKKTAVLECLPAGSRLEALSFRPEWLRVRTDPGREGWVATARVAPAFETMESPVAADLAEARAELERLGGEVTRLVEALEAERARSAALELESKQAANLASRVEREQTGRRATEIDLEAERSNSAQLEQQLAEVSGNLAAVRDELAGARAEAVAGQRKLEALLAEVDLQALVVSPDADPCLSVRGGPGTDTARLDCLQPGTELTVEDAADGWLSIATSEGAAGWVAARFVEPARALETSERTAELERTRRTLLAQVENLTERLRQADSESERKQARLEEGGRQSAALAARVAELETAAAAAEAATAAEAAARASVGEDLEKERSRARAALADLRDAEQALATLESRLEAERAQALAAIEITEVAVKEEVEPCLSLREAPELDSRALDCLPPGTRAAALGLAGSWFRLRLGDGREGWSSGRFLEPAERRTLRELTARLADRDQEVERLESRLAEAGSRDAESQRLALELEESRRELASLSARLREGERLSAASRKTAEAQTTRLEQELAYARQEAEELRAARQEAERLRAASQKAAEAQTARLEQDLADARREAEQLRETRKEAAEAQTARLQQELADARREVERLSALAGQAGEVPILRSALEQARGRLEASEAKNRELETELAARATTATEAEKAEGRLAELESSLASARQALAASQAANDALAAEIASLKSSQSSVDEVRAENDRLRDRLVELEAAIAARTAEPETERIARVREPLPATSEEAGSEQPAPTTPLATLPSVEREASAAGEPQTGIAVEDLPATVPADLEAFAKAWARAWSEQRVDDYLSFYSAGFVPLGGASRDAWERTRRERLTRPRFIEVELSNFRTEIVGDERATVSFAQAYRSDTFEDRVVKTLRLVREGDLWKIGEEIAE